ncbi:conserved Plasmodium protein, unknown function [Plasmodium knowlesi strain H]|uniref:Uncharacterized protein n=3 Tax=Plasmodium knowlesi TaxID=5850 RepID=A0A5K1V048_PLAKH|nr:conserved Plasmodium protein, unknown function [Plasmodium knowlesi strain H]OTN68735.1 Uncharacterized protein PKNOH_S01020000 [Plasmodium knowlesi]CAA9986197.1 conserved Plasmodium protein, unknown function [Plasmodium knowlesi strain H]SBO25401.1 conserved Plasmodium protein, unknown function [Plasmodium knowlesi strain H]SBO27691.1 conserved Plasmodium protein, unknown function [Plasmodium knowlesi strain H]VVS75671.1 conserved Plasmodium protein, unknown function [Plasmodium knowlesi s|eukprot:XP_002257607.1 hypothetical protein, conserved in Plasmodium species [Plasmodium knowlesi strain H]
MSQAHHDNNLYEQSLKITKKIKDKISNRKGSKEDFKEVKVKTVPYKYLVRNYKTICLCVGFCMNTFLYFSFCFIVNKIIDNVVFAGLSRVSQYDYANSLVAGSIKGTIILFLWFRHCSGGYDGDPFFHFFKSRLNLIGRGEAKVIFLSNVLGTLLYLGVKNFFVVEEPLSPISAIILERIQNGKVTKGRSILTSFVFPHVPPVVKNAIVQLIILTCPHGSSGNKYYNKTFWSSMDLYSSIVMDTYLNEMLCSFLNYVLLYIYLFTKDNLPYQLEINLLLTQVVLLFSTRCANVVGGPFMSLSWILNESLSKRYHFFFLLFLIIFHYLGYKLASHFLGPPKLSLVDAATYYKNVKHEVLQKNVDSATGRVNISLVANDSVMLSEVEDTYLGRFFQRCFQLYGIAPSAKKTA